MRDREQSQKRLHEIMLSALDNDKNKQSFSKDQTLLDLQSKVTDLEDKIVSMKKDHKS